MSRLGDILVELGPITQDYVASPGLSSDMRWIRAADLNALRDELIELRQIRAACPAEHAEPRTAAGHPAHTPGDSQ
jgi:hypothetical protein